MNSEKKKTTWKRTRKFFNDLHLWMGLSSGLIVLVICFSGTVYVFNTELRELASPGLYQVETPPESLTTTKTLQEPDDVIAAVEKATGGKAVSIRMPFDINRTWHVSVRKSEPAKSKKEQTPSGGDEHSSNANKKTGASKPQGRPNMGTFYAVNPYTGEIIGDVSGHKNGTTEFMRDMFSLHRWLMLDRIEEPIFGELPNRKLGSYITGTATILFTLGLLTGLVIWFPQKIKSWKQGLAIKWKSNWKRVNHDLHNTLAFYSFIFLLLMGITGPQWSFDWYRDGLRKTLGTYTGPDAPRPEQPRSVVPLDSLAPGKPSLADFIAVATKRLPYDGDYTVSLPADSTGAVVISKTKVGFFAPAAGDRVYLDQYTAAVITTDIFTDKPLNERITGSIKAIHLGDVYGKFTKILYFFACLVATSLPVTGTLIWINKLKKKAKKAAKQKRAMREGTTSMA